MKKLLGVFLGMALFLPGVSTKAAMKISAPTAEPSAVSVSGLQTPEEQEFFALSEEKKQVSAESVDLQLNAKAAYMMDWASGTEILATNATERLPIASMCKIMTLILCFDAVESGNLDLDEEIMVSDRAASMGGSQVFLEANAKYPARELIKSIIVCSANDSCVAMAERIAGSESLFTDKMNARAKELGASNTLFANCTGLPKEPQYSCAHDVAKMLAELVSHEEYFSFSKIWTDKFEHPQGRYTEISNTNRLIRFYDGCDGGKTGFTNQAGFCLAATAKRGGMRIVSVVIGEDTSDHRFGDIRTMFDYAFATYTLKTVVDDNNPLSETIEVSGGKSKNISVRPERSSHIFSKRGDTENVTIDIQLKNRVKAPVKAGDKVGEIIVYKDNLEIDRVAVVANESAEAAGFLDHLRRVAQGWNL